MEKSQDPDFGREGMDTVTSDLSKAPYYAVQISPGIHHTMGGVEINNKSEVLDKDGNVIPAWKSSWDFFWKHYYKSCNG